MNLRNILISLGAVGAITVAMLLQEGVDPKTITDVQVINETSVRILTPEGVMVNAGSPKDIAANYPEFEDKVTVKLIEWREDEEAKKQAQEDKIKNNL